jgi:6-pyruvoyltetrahydropterin/6-carboxytetrahydropterin synthase
VVLNSQRQPDLWQKRSMPFRICKSFEIESGHLLSKHRGSCRFPHGHSRRIDIVLTSAALDANDMVCDFKAIKEALAGFIARWDHALCLNTDDPQFPFFQTTYGDRVVAFTATDPTTEVLAKALYEETRRQLAEKVKVTPSGHAIADGVRIERVRVTETQSSWAEYFE